METSIRILSEAFCPVHIEDHFSIAVSKSYWQKVLEDDVRGRLFLRIQSGSKEWIGPLGQPVDDQLEDVAIYLPLWMVDSAGFQGLGEEGVCTLLDKEAFPEASKITLRVVDSAFYNSEVKEELEIALSALGVLKRHSVLQIPMQQLEGYRVEVFVSNTEPAEYVLCEGEEVAVEFEEPVDQIEQPQQQRPPTPIPLEVPMLSHEFVQQATGFVAFQGQGHTLGGSNSHIPEWRRGIPPPRRRFA